MPSLDKQSIWEELKDFPDQVLARDQAEKIAANIREERQKLLKQHKHRNYLGWVANGLVTCTLFLAFFWIKPPSFPAETAGSASFVDPTYSTAAQKAIEAAGITKEFHFEETEKDEDYLIVRTKNREAIVTFQPDTTEVRTVSAIVTVKELPDRYQKYVATARAAFQEAKQDVDFGQVHLFQDNDGAALSFEAGDSELDNRQFVRVDLKTNTVSDFLIDYKLDDVGQKPVHTAQKAFMLLSHNKSFSFTEAQKYTDAKEQIWKLTNAQDHYSVQVGAKTGKVHHISYVSDYHIKSIQEVIPVTRPLIQSIFGLDITGYQAYGGKDWGGYVLKHPGKPDISVHLADLDIGNISGISVKW